MGISNSKIPADLILSDADKFQKISETDYYNVLQNQDNPTDVIQEYHIIVDDTNHQSSKDKKVDNPEKQHKMKYAPNDVKDNIDIYHQRKTTERNIVRVRAVTEIEKQPMGFCGGSQRLMKVAIDQPAMRLTEVNTLTESDFMTVLYNTLHGSKYIKTHLPKHRQFELSKQMVCITKEGETRVWFHENYGMNTPKQIIIDNEPMRYSSKHQSEISQDSHKKHRSEKMMVKNIIQVMVPSIAISEYNANDHKDDRKSNKVIRQIEKVDSLKEAQNIILEEYKKEGIQVENNRINLQNVNQPVKHSRQSKKTKTSAYPSRNVPPSNVPPSTSHNLQTSRASVNSSPNRSMRKSRSKASIDRE